VLARADPLEEAVADAEEETLATGGLLGPALLQPAARSPLASRLAIRKASRCFMASSFVDQWVSTSLLRGRWFRAGINSSLITKGNRGETRSQGILGRCECS